MHDLVVIIEIILINIVLSGDNAIVIAMASKNLPDKQRRSAVWIGSWGAVALRLMLTAAAVFLLQIPYLHMVGSVLLMYIALKLLWDDEEHANYREAGNLRTAVWTIIVADLIMSLDNVLAIAAVSKGNFLLLALGIAISIPLIVWGSAFVMRLLHKFPALIYLGAGILGYSAGEMFIADKMAQMMVLDEIPELHWFLPIGGMFFVIVAGLIKRKKWIKII